VPSDEGSYYKPAELATRTKNRNSGAGPPSGSGETPKTSQLRSGSQPAISTIAPHDTGGGQEKKEKRSKRLELTPGSGTRTVHNPGTLRAEATIQPKTRSPNRHAISIHGVSSHGKGRINTMTNAKGKCPNQN